MIVAEDAEKACDFIRDNAAKFATAKSLRVYNEEYKKSLKAILFSEYEGSAAVREEMAYADQRYIDHLQELKNSVFEEEKLRGLMKAAEIKSDLYRSMNANLRGLK